MTPPDSLGRRCRQPGRGPPTFGLGQLPSGRFSMGTKTTLIPLQLKIGAIDNSINLGRPGLLHAKATPPSASAELPLRGRSVNSVTISAELRSLCQVPATRLAGPADPFNGGPPRLMDQGKPRFHLTTRNAADARFLRYSMNERATATAVRYNQGARCSKK
jgi:hypothetical protein